MDEHELRFKLDQLNAGQERAALALTRIEVLLADMQFSLPDEAVRAAWALFLQERERMDAQCAAVNERIDGLEERFSQQADALAADIGAIRRHLLGDGDEPEDDEPQEE
jgi:hypothetical protein